MTPTFSIWPLAAILVSLLGALPILLSHRQPNLRESWTIFIALAKLSIVASLLPGVLQGGGYIYTIAEVIPDDLHAADKRFGQDVVRLPPALKQDVRAFLDLFLQTIVEIVVHLQDKLVVIQFTKDDIVFFVGHGA